jgi:hypothetical protein
VSPQDLVGAWSLVSFVVHREGRPDRHPFGPDARGLIVYEPSGWMSAVLSAADRSSGATRLEDAHRSGADAKAQAYDSYLSYAGRWRMEGEVVVHEVQLALVPEVVGQAQRRRVALEGDELVLSYELEGHRGTARFLLRWRRPPTT